MSKRGILIFNEIIRIPRDSIYCDERFGILDFELKNDTFTAENAENTEIP
jgi:hypothetical protein